MPENNYDPAIAAGQEALEFLRLVLVDDEKVEPARVSAARALLDRFTPKEDAERKRHEAEERAAALAEAQCLLAEFAIAKSAGIHQPPALDQSGPAEPTDTAAS
jgi:hypothetical protein